MILAGRGSLFIVPLMYAVATHAIMIYMANALAGFSVATSVNSITAYIFDIAPEKERGAHLAVFNTFTGIIYFFGALTSGLLGDSMALVMGAHFAVFSMMVLSAVLRLISSSLYLMLREPREYSSNMRMELRSLVLRRKIDADVN